MKKTIFKITKYFGAILFLTLWLSALIACTHFTNPDHKSSSMIGKENVEQLSIPISLFREKTPKKLPVQISMKDLTEFGKLIIFGTDDPLAKLARGQAFIGQGQCPLCHRFFPEQRGRGPIMFAGQTTDSTRLNLTRVNTPDPALAFSIEVRSHQRIKEDRYQIAKNRHAKGEKNSGIKPHAKTGGEYLIESLYCPNCYVALGWGLKGTDDTVSPMPIIHLNPFSLTDLEIIAVIAYLQSKETPGNYSKVTVLQDWENYFGKQLTLPSGLQRRIRRTRPKK